MTVSFAIVELNRIVQSTENTKGVIYKPTVSYKNKEKIYIGSTGRQLKSRYYEHTQSFRSEVKKESKRLSRFIHKVKNDNVDWKNIFKWEIIQRTNQKRPGNICSLCNLERLEIAFEDNNKLLNLRSELVGKRKFFSKFYLFICFYLLFRNLVF